MKNSSKYSYFEILFLTANELSGVNNSVQAHQNNFWKQFFSNLMFLKQPTTKLPSLRYSSPFAPGFWIYYFQDPI